MDIKTMDTKAFIQEFIDSMEDETQKRLATRIDRIEIYEYEKEIGKKLLEMNPDELFGMLKKINSRKADNPRSISYLSYESLASTFRKLWEYYCDNYDLIRNPWNRPEMKGTTAKKRLSKEMDAFTQDDYNQLIQGIRRGFDGENEAYIECVVSMFYDGFADADEIINTKEHMINPKSGAVYLQNKTIHLQDRTFDLLRHIHSLEEIPAWRGVSKMVPYHDSYFKFIVRPSNEKSFQDIDVREVRAKITQIFSIRISQALGVTISPRTVYLLGFYERMKAKFGYEKTREMIMSLRNQEYNQILTDFAQENGGYFISVTVMKNYLIPFVESDELNTES